MEKEYLWMAREIEDFIGRNRNDSKKMFKNKIFKLFYQYSGNKWGKSQIYKKKKKIANFHNQRTKDIAKN